MIKNKKKSLAPILLFTYRRYSNLKKTIDSLKKNYGYNNHELYIFSDGPKNKNEIHQIKKVRKYLNKITGFKKKKVIIRRKNIGLTKNITSGISQIIAIKKKVIVLEDDIILSKNFLNYMNYCLSEYYNEKKVWHINGWNYNFNLPNIKENTFFWRGMHCWGWGTWENRWKKYKRNPTFLVKNWSKKKINEFNYDGAFNFWSQVERNQKKIINTWAIFWYSSIFKNHGICLSPLKSLTRNIGYDKFSTNDPNLNNIQKNILVKKKIKFIFSNKIIENKIIYNSIKKNLKLRVRLKSKIKFLLRNFFQL